MWVFRSNNIKPQAIINLFIVAIFYKINPVQNTTNITEISKNSLKFDISHNKKLKFKLVRNSHLLFTSQI